MTPQETKRLKASDLSPEEMNGLVKTYLRDRSVRMKDTEDFAHDMWVIILTKKTEYTFTDKKHLKNWVKCMIDWEFRTRARNYKMRKLPLCELNDVITNTVSDPKKDDKMFDLHLYVEKHFPEKVANMFKLYSQGATLAEVGQAFELSGQRVHVLLEEVTSKLKKVFGYEQRTSI